MATTLPGRAWTVASRRRDSITDIINALLECEHFVAVFWEASGGASALSAIDMLKQAPRVTVTIDTVIFESGRVLGPDESRTVKRIRERKRVATDIVRLYRRAVEDGLDIETFLESLDSDGNVEYESYDFWIQNFAEQLHCGSRVARPITLMQYANLPELPVFKT